MRRRDFIKVIAGSTASLPFAVGARQSERKRQVGILMGPDGRPGSVLVLVSPSTVLIPVVAVESLLFLAIPGAVGARAGGAGLFKPTVRVTFWGAFAMGLTAGIGAVFGRVV